MLELNQGVGTLREVHWSQLLDQLNRFTVHLINRMDTLTNKLAAKLVKSVPIIMSMPKKNSSVM